MIQVKTTSESWWHCVCITSQSFHSTSSWVQFCMHVQQMETRLTWYTLLLVLHSLHLSELCSPICTRVQIFIIEHLPYGTEYVICFLWYKQQEDIQAGSEEPLLQILEGECEEISSDQGKVAQPLPQVIMTNAVNLFLSMKMFSKLVNIDIYAQRSKYFYAYLVL